MLPVFCILDLCKRILHAVRRGDKKQLVRPPLVAVDVQQIILDRRVRHEEQHQVHPCDTEIYASGGIRIVMLQEDRQRCHKNHDDARLKRRPEIPGKVAPDKILLQIREQQDQHVDHKHNAKAVHQLGLHVLYGHVPV